ncbi:Sec-independent protein translocase TatB [Nakamurella flava]|uniref:Sec-independent protein translocase protein TatB n=2 Tax=Nakamurella flava TaxID=2576308 RepID=A0A4U6QJ22_9ACTN|nr:Sec-independent protein translocase TatB [Nakamurella flava]
MMFGLSWTQIGIIVVVGVFVLGPERIPTAVRFVADGTTKVRGMVSGAQDGLRREIGPELDELRRQVAELQGLRDLIDLRDLHPQRLIGGALAASSDPAGPAPVRPPAGPSLHKTPAPADIPSSSGPSATPDVTAATIR